MPGQPYRVELESIHWPTLLPSLRLLDAFRLAVHPAKLLLAFALVLLLYLLGLGMDLAWGPSVHPNDLQQYTVLSSERYERWRVLTADAPERVGPFRAAVDAELAAFRQLLATAVTLDFGIRNFLAGQGLNSGGVIGALGRMTITIPAWLWHIQPLFLVLYLLLGYGLTALMGGALARLAALHACRDRRAGPEVGVRFAMQWYLWFAIAPLLPLVVAMVIAAILALAGLLLFNLPVLDILGGVVYGPMLLGGFLIGLVLLGLAVGVHVLYPAIAVEGTDAFDAVSRVYNFVLGRPFRFAVYVIVAVVYFAVTLLAVSLLLYWAAWLTNAAAGVGAFRTVAEGVTRLEAVTPELRPHAAGEPPRWEDLNWSGRVSAWLVLAWTRLLLLLIPAFAVSFYYSAFTWVYLLLRRAADGVDFDDIFVEDGKPAPAVAADELPDADADAPASKPAPAPDE
jgi:hypothetical protein